MATITKVPTCGVTGLSIARNSNGTRQIVAKWNIPKELSNDTDHRAEGFYVHFTINCVTHAGKAMTLKYERTAGASTTQWTFYFDEAHGFVATNKKHYYRSSFYPYRASGEKVDRPRIVSITASICPYNRKGSSRKWQSRTYKFEVPRTPVITGLAMNEQTGVVTMTVKHDAGNDYRENYHTYCWIGVWDNRLNNGKGGYVAQRSWTFGTNQETSSNTVDVTGRMGLYVGDYIGIHTGAWSRGIRGQSAKAEKRLYISYPWAPEITSIGFGDKAKQALTDNTKATVWCKTNATTPHPVSGIKLQVLRNTEYTRASQLSAEDWANAEDIAQDNGSCNALAALVGNLRSNDGLYTFIRLKTWNMFESIYYRFSTVRRLDEVFHALPTPPTAADDPCGIVSAVTGDNGESVDLVIAHNNDGNTGTEVSWSDDPDAWESTEKPKLFNVTWSKAASSTVHGTTYTRRATLHVRGLTEGTRYYFRARRYLEGEDATTYGSYDLSSGYVSCVPTSAPESVTLLADMVHPSGTDLLVSWSVEATAPQTSWQLITGETRTETEYYGTVPKTHYYIRGDTDRNYKVVNVARASDARGSYVIPWKWMKARINNTGSDTIPLAVRVSTGGDMVTSEAVLVTVVEAPTLTVTAADLTARPQTVTLACNKISDVALVVLSQGVSGDYPSGSRGQESGDAVWTDAFTPEWEAVVVDGEVTGWTATVGIPESADLMDGGAYTVTAVATDAVTGMESERASAEFGVDYSRKSPGPPEDGVIVTPYDVTEADTGWRTRGCTIELPESETFADGDYYDVYRVTPDGPDLIAEGIAPGTVIDDPFAPFGDDGGGHAYRVSVRTVDGCVNWADYQYELAGLDLRLDWDEGYVELPYNLSLSGQWEKPFERRRHLGGTVEGYWDEGTTYDEGLSTDLIRIGEPEKSRAVRALAAWCGPVLVRTPDGRCYDADVEVRSYGQSSSSGVLAVSLDAARVDLTEAHMAVLPEPEPEEEQGAGS